ncbi:serine hydrolase domain-containing protein [Micromonospora sp. NPDC049230]|uniref:serine hydrolase domain-containing protein n=1 Tax=Micromonospora sp. NPDC049230 TaxID=3155502 RepID=UPI0033DB77D8
MSDDALDSFPRLRTLVDKEIADGIETGVQLSISHAGVRHEIAVGDNGLGAPITPETPVPWTCSSKPIGALAFARAWESGHLGLDDRVADHLPEYGEGGKETVRVRDLLTHTTGVPDPMLTLDTDGQEMPEWDQVQALIWMVVCAAEPQQRPGTSMSYNPITNWFVLDRLLTTIAGTEAGDSYRSMFSLLGIAPTLGLDGDAAPPVAPVAPPEETVGLEKMHMAARLPLPGTGIWGAMRDLRSVGEALLTGRAADGTEIARRSTIEALTATHWPGTVRSVLSDSDFAYGLGFMTLPHLLGRACSFRAYGHAGGNTSSLVVDPAAEVVMAMYWNGRLADVPTVTRRHALVEAVYADLGIS